MLGPSIGGRSSVAPDGFDYLGFRTRLSQGPVPIPNRTPKENAT